MQIFLSQAFFIKSGLMDCQLTEMPDLRLYRADGCLFSGQKCRIIMQAADSLRWYLVELCW